MTAECLLVGRRVLGVKGHAGKVRKDRGQLHVHLQFDFLKQQLPELGTVGGEMHKPVVQKDKR